MNNKCQIANHSNRVITTICFAPQCQGKRVCCLKCQAEFHKDHDIDQLADINYLLDFIKTQSQQPNTPSPQVMQEVQELNNILKDIQDLAKLIGQEIQRLVSTNFQQFCKELGNAYNIFTEQVGNQQWNDLAQEMLSRVELKDGEIVEKDPLVTHLGKSYSDFMKQFSLILRKMISELKVENQFMDLKQNIVQEHHKIIKQIENNPQVDLNQDQDLMQQNDQITDPNNPFNKLTVPHVLKGHTDTIFAIDICEKRNLLVSGSLDDKVKLWNLQDNTLLKTYQDTDNVFDAVFSSEGHFLAFCGFSFTISLIELKDLKNNDIVSKLQGHSHYVNRLTFSNDEIYLISGSEDTTVRVWNVQAKEELFKLDAGSIVYGLTMSRDNKLIASHSWTKGIKIWNIKNQKLLCTHDGHFNGAGISFSDDQQMLVSSGEDGIIKLWSLQQLDQGKLLLMKEFKAANTWIQRVQLTSDSRFIISYCWEDRQVKVMDSNTGHQVKLFELKGEESTGNIEYIGDVSITKKMNIIAYGDGSEIIVWRME